MRVAHIVPTALLPLTKLNNYHLVLPHLLETDNTYYEFYREVDGHIILDNGVAENVEFDTKALLDFGAHIAADEVVVPDVMGDCDRTIAEARRFADYAHTYPQFDYIGVVQGKSYSDLTKCLAFFEQTEWISVIALPRVLCNTVHKDIRFNFAEAFKDRLMARFKAVHCLGASSNIKEAILLSDCEAIRGIDTSMPAVMGLDKRLIEIDGYITRSEGFFEAKPNPKQLMCIEHNLALYVEWAR